MDAKISGPKFEEKQIVIQSQSFSPKVINYKRKTSNITERNLTDTIITTWSGLISPVIRHMDIVDLLI